MQIDADKGRIFAVLGKAGSGKTQLLAMLTEALKDADAVQIDADGGGKRRGQAQLCGRRPDEQGRERAAPGAGVAATTIHRIIYTPVYDPEYEKIAEWLRDKGKGEQARALDLLNDEAARPRARLLQGHVGSVPGALATVGVRGSEFITGWARRGDDHRHRAGGRGVDARHQGARRSCALTFKHADPVRRSGATRAGGGEPARCRSSRSARNTNRAELGRVLRQEAGHPVIDLAYALGDPELGFS